MPIKKNPLENARKRVKEKLSSIEEQSEFICQFINDLTTKATAPATELLQESERTKFFSKYSSVSQELEKCLDTLLLISDSITTLADEDTELNEEEDVAVCSSASELPAQQDKVQNESQQTKLTADGGEEVQQSVGKDGSNENQEEIAAYIKAAKSEGVSVKEHKEPSSSAQEQKPESLKRTEVVEVSGSMDIPHGEKHEPEGVSVKEPIGSSEAKDVSGLLGRSEGQKQEPGGIQDSGRHVLPQEFASNPTAEALEETKTLKDVTASPGSSQADKLTPSVQAGAFLLESKQAKDGNVKSKENTRNVSTKGTKKKRTPQKTRKVVTVSRRTSSSSSIQDVVREIKAIHAVTGVLDLCQVPPSKAVYLKPYPFENGSSLEVIVTEVLSPWEFWVQPSLEDFNDLMEEMCFYYAKAAAAGYKGGLTEAPNVGSFCCARFSADDTWYRVVVTAAHAHEKNPRFEVLCVDDGHRDVLSLSHLRPLGEKFATLPCQAICCALSGVQPRPPDPLKKRQVPSVWDEESTEWLKSKVSGMKLVAYPTRTEDGCLVTVDLYRCPGTRTPQGQVPAAEYSISQQMIKEGKCNRIGLPADSQSIRSVSPRSFRSDESLSRCSSLTSVSSGAQEGCMPVFSNETGLICSAPATGGDFGPTDGNVVQLDVAGDGKARDLIQQLDQGTPVIPLEDVAVSRDESQESGPPVDAPLASAFVEAPPVDAPLESTFVEAPPVDAPLESAFVEAPPVDAQSSIIQVMMSHVVSPSEFYVHLVTPEAGLLDIMMDEINEHYNGIESSIENIPQVGDYYCARFSEDQRWYRVQVRSVRPDEQKSEDDVFTSAEAEVFYIDFGNTEWVSVAEIRQLETWFMQLPGQVIKCSLANTQPLSAESDPTSVVEDPPVPKPAKESPLVQVGVQAQPPPNANTQSLKNRRRRKAKIKIDKNVIVRAAGDESCDSSELSEMELVSCINNDIAKSKEGHGSSQSVDKVGLPEKYLMPTSTGDVQNQKAFPTAEAKPVPKWTEEAVELFKGLCEDEKPLVAHIVPWNVNLFDRLFDPAANGEQVDIFLQKPELCLYLYDTTGDEDIFINQILTETGLAVFLETDVSGVEDINTITLTEDDLREDATALEENNSDEPVLSPTSREMKKWDPMATDFMSVKNTYAIDTDDADIAFQGYKNPSRNICRFYQRKTGCWRGSSCPDVHAKDDGDTMNLVEAFCDNVDCVVPLPDPGTWVAVCVTAVFNPGHFWVQFPYGPEPVEKQIIGARSGECRDEEEDLDTLMDEMCSFYSSNVCQDPNRILNAIGEIVVAKYSRDGRWYRARVTDVRDEELQVFFVDYGNSEWTAENNIKRMIPHFLHLPFQAVECFLANVEPANEEDCGWSHGAKEAFKTLAADKVMIAHVLSKAWNKTLYLDLYDTEGLEDVHINKALIEKRFAKESKHIVSTPWDMTSSKHKLAGLPG